MHWAFNTRPQSSVWNTTSKWPNCKWKVLQDDEFTNCCQPPCFHCLAFIIFYSVSFLCFMALQTKANPVIPTYPKQQNEPDKSQAFTNISKATVIMKFIHSGKIRFPTIITIWAEIICVCASHLSWGAPTDLCPKFCAQAKLAFLRPAAHWHLARGTPFACDTLPLFVFAKFTSKKHQKQKTNHTKPGVARPHEAILITGLPLGSTWNYSNSN